MPALLYRASRGPLSRMQTTETENLPRSRRCAVRSAFSSVPPICMLSIQYTTRMGSSGDRTAKRASERRCCSTWTTDELRRTGELSGDGFIGYGISYTRMLSKKYAFAAGINHDIVGHFADQIDVSVPFTGEFQRVFKTGADMRSYVGLGGGYYFRKFYRTGTEYNTTAAGGAHVSIGLASQLDDKHVVGFDTRVAWVQGRPGITNPTFGPGTDTETIWTAKLTWALVY